MEKQKANQRLITQKQREIDNTDIFIRVLYFRISVTNFRLSFLIFTPFHFPPKGKGFYAGAVEKVFYFDIPPLCSFESTL